jgi:hypothetical protein
MSPAVQGVKHYKHLMKPKKKQTRRKPPKGPVNEVVKWGQTEYYEMSQHPNMTQGHYYGVAYLMSVANAEFRQETDGWTLVAFQKPSKEATQCRHARSHGSMSRAASPTPAPMHVDIMAQSS